MPLAPSRRRGPDVARLSTAVSTYIPTYPSTLRDEEEGGESAACTRTRVPCVRVRPYALRYAQVYKYGYDSMRRISNNRRRKMPSVEENLDGREKARCSSRSTRGPRLSLEPPTRCVLDLDTAFSIRSHRRMRAC